MSAAPALKPGDDVAVRTTVDRVRSDGNSSEVGLRILGSDEVVWADAENVRPLRVRHGATSFTVTLDGPGTFAIEAAGRRANRLTFDEMLGALVALAHPDIGVMPPLMHGAGSEHVAKAPTDVTLKLPLALAEVLSEGLADLLCWCRGFVAAAPDSPERHPMGVAETRDMRVRLDAAIADARGIEPKELPF